MRLIYHPEAEAELVDAAEYYEERLPGLGAEFLEAVDAGVDVVLSDFVPQCVGKESGVIC
jgi:toxin ParE1/3/4